MINTVGVMTLNRAARMETICCCWCYASFRMTANSKKMRGPIRSLRQSRNIRADTGLPFPLSFHRCLEYQLEQQQKCLIMGEIMIVCKNVTTTRKVSYCEFRLLVIHFVAYCALVIETTTYSYLISILQFATFENGKKTSCIFFSAYCSQANEIEWQKKNRQEERVASNF